ncbi:DUF7346 family protein [Natronorarus salvus]|uniref:DUF7346 family protein n=1 Tax=Natronorarus salvus TaxID=3117733 RepID=UPI002F2659F9
MRTVEDDEGGRYLLRKRSAESSLVFDPETGEERYVENARLSPVGGESPLETAARTVSAPTRTLLSAVHNDRGLGLLLELDRRGPLSVRELMAAYDLCESDLHGRIAELHVSGLIEETSVNGERGYTTTDLSERALDALR